MNDTIELDVEVNGLDETIDKAGELADLLHAIPPQVVIRGARHCTFNIHPSQIITMPQESGEGVEE